MKNSPLRWTFVAILAIRAAFAPTPVAFAAEPGGEVKNVIFLIGDGMGLAQVAAASAVNRSPLHLEKCSAVGLSKTASASDWVTDSAAGGTALSSGYKTTNGFVGVRPDGTPGRTLLEEARDRGKAIGVAVTCSVTHATPASFLAHRGSRGRQEEIAEDIVASGVDVFIGGGRKFFEARTDGRNLSDVLRNKGYTIAYSMEEARRSSKGKLGVLLAEDGLPKMTENRGDVLPQSFTMAVNLLSQDPDGFVLMVEGSQIDWGCHKNDADWSTAEVLDFDQVVGRAMEFADANPGTLVVVTADHETGGMTLVRGDREKGTVEAKFSTPKHTGVMVPVYAYGAGAQRFTGVYENTEVFHKIADLLNFSKTSPAGQ